MQEATDVNTGILRLALGVEDARSYWERSAETAHAGPATIANRALVAFEHRWFGNKSLPRVQFLLGAFATRYDAFPAALAYLQQWHGMDAATRTLVCHWHLQLSDPMYRRFTGEFLVERRRRPGLTVDRFSVLRWVKDEYVNEWSAATYMQFATKLISAAANAGLISANRDPRTLLAPVVTERALEYLMYLLREVSFAGSLTANPYLASVGVVDDVVDNRLRNLRTVGYSRMDHLVEFAWQAADLRGLAGLTSGGLE